MLHREQRRAKPDQKAKKHKEELAALVEAQRKVETLGYLDSGGETGDPDQGGYEEATDVLGKHGDGCHGDQQDGKIMIMMVVVMIYMNRKVVTSTSN